MSHQLSRQYIAGFFDGEGCIRISSNCKDRGFGIHVFITNTYKPILDKIQSQYGGSVTLRDKATLKHRTCYQWRISNKREALVFLNDMESTLIEKRDQALLGIEFCNLGDIKANRFTRGDPLIRERKEEIKVTLSALKRIDHG